jgi:methylenetetrahydrofolate reductase (NADPH)
VAHSGGMAGHRARRALAPLAPLLRHPRYEVFPSAGAEDTVRTAVPMEVTVTVTASQARGLDATVELTGRLAARGYQVVPHLPARLVRDDAHLADVVDRLLASGVTDVFVPAGDAAQPAGRFTDAISLLDRLAAMSRPFPEVGVTGYPQRHPRIADEAAAAALWDKRHHATYLVSNLCLDPVVLSHWIRAVRARGITLPLRVGLSGPVDRARLLRLATVAGVPGAARFAVGHRDWLLRATLPGGYRPTRLLERTAGPLADPASAVTGLHIFTFNQVERAERWRTALLRRLDAAGR